MLIAVVLFIDSFLSVFLLVSLWGVILLTQTNCIKTWLVVSAGYPGVSVPLQANIYRPECLMRVALYSERSHFTNLQASQHLYRLKNLWLEHINVGSTSKLDILSGIVRDHLAETLRN